MRWAIGHGVLLALALTTAPASAFFKRDLNAPWCLAYSDMSGIVDCGFYTYKECLETMWGVGGSCTPNYNTRYAEQPPRPKRKRRY